MKKYAILGAGGHGKVVYDALKSRNCGSIEVFDQTVEKKDTFLGESFIQYFNPDRLASCDLENLWVIAIGDNLRRREKFELLNRLGCHFALVRHVSSICSPDAVIQEGSVVFAGAIVNPGASVGRNVIVNTGVIVEHDCKVHNHAQLCPRVTLAGNVVIEEEVFVGTGAIVIPGVRIGARSVIAAGAVVIKDVPPDTLVAGVPAQIKKHLV